MHSFAKQVTPCSISVAAALGGSAKTSSLSIQTSIHETEKQEGFLLN